MASANTYLASANAGKPPVLGPKGGSAQNITAAALQNGRNASGTRLPTGSRGLSGAGKGGDLKGPGPGGKLSR